MSDQVESSLLASATPAELSRVGHWAGQLSLCLSNNGEKTVLSSREQTGPYTLQRPLYPEGNVCHLILLHPPGGLVEGDTLTLSVQSEADTHALLTTPSAGKVYRCQQQAAGQSQKFSLQENAKLEWFPQETIVFDGSNSELSTEIQLVDDAQFIGWEILCLGRPVADDYFNSGRVRQSIKLSRDEEVLFTESLLIDSNTHQDDSSIRDAAWGLAGFSVSGTLLMTGVSESLSKLIQQQVHSSQGDRYCAGVTLLDDLLVCRALAHQSRHIKDLFIFIWKHLRPEITGQAAMTPRIWQT